MLGLALLALALLFAQGLGRMHGVAHGLHVGLHAAVDSADPLGARTAPGSVTAEPADTVQQTSDHAAHAHGDPHPAAGHAADHAAGSALCELIDDLAQAPLDLPALPGLAAGPRAEARPAAPRPASPQAEAPVARARDPPAPA